MAEPVTIRLARQEGVESRTIDAALTADGRITVTAQDIGPTAKALYGGSDYEFGIAIAPEHAARFALALITDHYAGDADAVARLRALAERAGIDPGFWVWT